MGWSDWISEKDTGDKVSEKVDSRPDGGTTEHYLRDTGGSKSDHQHIVVEKDSTGRAERAHGYPNKSRR